MSKTRTTAPRTGRKVLGGLAAAFGALALAAGPAQAQAPAAVDPLERAETTARAKGVYLAQLKAKGTNGYKITVFGLTNDDEVTVAARKGKAKKFISANYTAPGSASTKRMSAKLGKFGELDLRFVEQGKARKDLPRGCKGKPDRIQRGIWKGVLRFKGKRGFTKVNLSSARGSITRFGSYTCGDGGETGVNLVMLHAWKGLGKRGATDFTVVQEDRPRAVPHFSASRYTKVGKVLVTEIAFRRGKRSQFHFTAPEPTGDADLNPKSPFSGSARYRAGSWKGNLKVRFPSKRVKLTGKGFKAELTTETLG